ncbi:MAG: odd Oz/ten-m homolog 4 [uncultured Campylobacterales bacterium]|uniref:Odd Oz/ten-m homolog 4 n=1 Tax=uncultured Campylobacterales bacterium TaxID=352960 RepID=A0A6S6SZ70_9BACT|nr:MAG: odd Oz/ten-m homolog 4 [uncultured Campylobacterales bacterium]
MYKILFLSIILLLTLTSCTETQDDSEPETTTPITTPPTPTIITPEITNTPYMIDTYTDFKPDDVNTTYDDNRFLLITGSVKDINNNPLTDVTITIKDNSQYGSIRTDTNGSFTLPLESGSYVIKYSKDGYIPSERAVNLEANQINIADDITLLAYDTIKTKIDLDSNEPTTHISSVISDDRGTRQAYITFPNNLNATLVKPDGSKSNLTELNFRSTEFTTPESMPSTLPPTTAFTYCIDMDTIEANNTDSIIFDKNITIFVDNFLEVQVGEIVPAGYYDANKSRWIGIQNGIIVKAIDSNADGEVDGLDITGDDIIDTNISNDGIQNLEVNQTYTRATTSHFSSIDLNYPWGPPENAKLPNTPNPQLADSKICPIKSYTNSYIKDECYNTDIPIKGTNLTLHYNSKKTNTKKLIRVPLPPSIPDSAKQLLIELEIAGNRYISKYHPNTNLEDKHAEFHWDGKDKYNNFVHGNVKATIKIGLQYPITFYSTSRGSGNAWASAGANPLRRTDGSSIEGRDIVLYSTKEITIPILSDKSPIASSWTLSNNHFLNDGLLEYGNGNLKKDEQNSEFKIEELLTSESYIEDMDKDSKGNIIYLMGDNVYKYDIENNTSTILATRPENYTLKQIRISPDDEVYLILRSIYTSYRKYLAKIQNNEIEILNAIGYKGYSGSLGHYYYSPHDFKIDNNGEIYYIHYEYSVYYRSPTPQKSTLRRLSDGKVIKTFNKLQNPRFDIDKDGDFIVSGYVRECGNFIFKSKVNGDDTILYTDAKDINTSSDFDNIVETCPTQYAYSGIDDIKALGSYIYYTKHSSAIYKLNTSSKKGYLIAGAQRTATSTGYSVSPHKMLSINTRPGLFIDSSNNIVLSVVNGSSGTKFLKFTRSKFYAKGDKEVYLQDSQTRAYTFNEQGYHLETINPKTNQILQTFTYDENNNLLSTTDSLGNSIELIRDSSGIISSIKAPNGDITYLDVDSSNNLKEVKYDDGRTYQFNYTNNLLTSQLNPLGKEITSSYDDYGLIRSQTNSENNSFILSKESVGNEDQTIINNNGSITTHIQDENETHLIQRSIYPSGDTRSITKSDNTITVSECDVNTTMKSIYNEDTKQDEVYQTDTTLKSGLTKTTYRTLSGNTTTLRTNNKATTVLDDGLTRTITSPRGKKIIVKKNEHELITEIEPYDLEPIKYEYFDNGDLKSIIQGTRKQEFNYNDKRLLASKSDELNVSTSYAYDNRNYLTSTNRSDKSMGFISNDMGDVTSLTTPLTKKYNFIYNTNSQIKSESSPLSKQSDFTYNDRGDLISISTPSSKAINYAYTDTRLTNITYPSKSVNIAYYCGDLPSSISNGTNSKSIVYDGDLPTQISLRGEIDEDIDLEYNSDFLVSKLSYLDKEYTLTYNNDNELTKVNDYNINKSNKNGLPTQISGDNIITNFSFNNYGELSDKYTYLRKVSGVYTGVDYRLQITKRNDRGQITELIDTLGAKAVTKSYEYDEYNRLAKYYEDGNLTNEYSYDLQGNRLSHTVNDDSQTLSDGNGTSYTYNDDGYLHTKTNLSGTTTYTYNLLGELERVVTPSKTITYTHNTDNQVVSKSVDGVVKYKYVWSDLTTLLGVFDGSDNLLMRFNYLEDRVPFSMDYLGSTHYLHYDQVGSLRAVSNSNGLIVKEVAYSPYGEVLSDSNTSFYLPFGFAGGFVDSDTKLVRFGYRDYDPSLGKWTAIDPIRFNGGDTNLYNYVLNDPVNLIDPTGMFWEEVFAVGYLAWTVGKTAYKGWKLIVGAITAYGVYDYSNKYDKKQKLANQINSSDMSLEDKLRALNEINNEFVDDTRKVGKTLTGTVIKTGFPKAKKQCIKDF